MGNKFTKSVSFNVTNKEDEIILKAVKRRNFSGYVKKLILADIQAKQLTKKPQTVEEFTKPVVAKKEITEFAFEQLKKRQQQMKSSAPKVFRPGN